MDKKEAFKELFSGNKIRHVDWPKHEFIYYNDNKEKIWTNYDNVWNGIINIGCNLNDNWEIYDAYLNPLIYSSKLIKNTLNCMLDEEIRD